MKKQYTLPTFVGLFLLIVGIVSGVFLIQSDKVFETRASPEETPTQVRITNITDTSFTVSWTTQKQVQGFIAYGKSSSLGTVVQQSSNFSNPYTHHVTVDNLMAQTTYFFKVGSADKLFDNNGQLYQIKTASVPSGNTPSPDIVFGTILDAQGKAAPGSIVYINLLGVTPLSVLADQEGKWSIPLSTARSTNLTNYANYSPETTLEIFVQAGNNKFATAKVKTKGAHPVPPITLGQNHDFSQVKTLPNSTLPESKVTLPGSGEVDTRKKSGFSVDSSQQGQTKITISLTSPANQENINTNLPQFIGTGTANTLFSIKVEPKNLTHDLQVNNRGSWSWTATEELDTGENIVTLSWKDETGQTRILTRSFTVLAQGSSNLPSFTASGSGTTSTSTSTPAPTSTPRSSATPTATATAIPITTPTPTATTIATGSSRVGLPSTSSGTPAAGYLTPSIMIIIMGAALILLGLFIPRIKTN